MAVVRPYAIHTQNNPHDGIKVQKSKDQESGKGVEKNTNFRTIKL